MQNKELGSNMPVSEINRSALELSIRQQSSKFYSSLSARHAHLFADVQLEISAKQLAQMKAVIAAVERVVALPLWSSEPSCEKSKGVFFGYDFHLNDSGANLIEINTNAGGAFLNALLLNSQQGEEFSAAVVVDFEYSIVEMFRNEWRLERGDVPLTTIAIIDEQPDEQYLYPEFVLAQALFERNGMRAFIADPSELSVQADGLYLAQHKIDLVYNRLTDFSLESHPSLLNAYRSNQVLVTPSPQAYTRYADKRNLVRLSDADLLATLGADEESIRVLQKGVPQTRLISEADAELWWNERKQWFFKPVSGYGAKGAYRGDKLTKRVFAEILSGDYVAQRLAAPGECSMAETSEPVTLKYDVRCYVYDGQVQLFAARLYQGQTTNFRTSGGGFALLRVKV